MSKTFMVVAETRDGKLRQVSLEALQAAELAKEDGDQVTAVLLGYELIGPAEELARCFQGRVLVVDHPDLKSYLAETYISALSQVLSSITPDLVLFGHTTVGRDLAPQVASRLQAGQISDVTAIENSGGDIIYTRPVYAGKAFEKKRLIGGSGIITLRPNNIPPAGPASSPAEITAFDYAPASSLRSVIKDVVRKATGKIDLTEAKVVISGGRGVKSAEGFKPLEELAEVLQGAVGASRGACDAGYCDYALQIGQTGKVVTPEIYIACGISGAIQHLAGMSQSRVIIAINKDPEAPIFKVADYGIVGDLFEVVPLLTQEFKQALA
ncbi:electron transfer flavoprotein subunit alpha/FixB family protein [Paenibacillus sp. FSL R5-0407]|uniref:electron transfer flavoprotein subunit alpha/FixB family protein n=1 Tax=Paenibacillus TaxID=44249 RepID=UPI0025B668D1|nr:electron transfer flavoprotein subunit alpha/FixB family protein [Paenibacillus vini]MDN4070472.1 electron transfer flavoprotein subunit alpha/FixB family protein [Paenibacillus vini]